MTNNELIDAVNEYLLNVAERKMLRYAQSANQAVTEANMLQSGNIKRLGDTRRLVKNAIRELSELQSTIEQIIKEA